MKKILLSLLVFYFISLAGFAQTRSVNGKVIAEDDDMGLPGVSVMIKGTLKGTSTDFNGDFNLEGVTDSDFLVFSFIGFKDQEISIGDKKNIFVTMRIDANELNEVVVTGLGIKRQKRELGYSTDKVESDVLVRSNAPNVINAIAGRSAGVQVSQGNGVEGGSTRITIRGNNNIYGNNQPLIVIDNVPMENTSGLDNIGRGTDWGNPISDINPQDIETYTILKGGPASAKYGERGANGVILITTKKGKKQEGIGVTYSFTHKITQPYRYRDVQNKYGAGGPVSFSGPSFPMVNDTMQYPGVYGTDNLVINEDGDISNTSAEFGYYGSAVSWGPEMNGEMVKWWDGKMRAYSPQPNNYKEPFQNGYTQVHNVSASGGNDIGSVRVSINRQDNKAIIDNSDFDRTTINLGSSINISKKIKADASVSYIRFNRLNSPILGDEGNSFNKGYLYSWPRSYQGIDKDNYVNPDGSINEQEGYPFLYVGQDLWWNYYKNNTTLNRDKYVGSLSLSYDITNWINMIARAGKDFSTEHFTSVKSPRDAIGLEKGYYGSNLTKKTSDIYEVLVQAEKEIVPKFKVGFTAGASRTNWNHYGIGGHSGTWYYPNMYTFFNLTQPQYEDLGDDTYNITNFGDTPKDLAPSETIWRKRTNSVFSFLNLSYDNYLFLELTGRNDWSSTLPPESNSYFYPSASVSFVASEAFNIQEKVSWLNFVKIRGGLSQTATGADPYVRHFYYDTDFFAGQQSSYLPGTIPPLALKPQRVNSYEGGLNMAFLDNRIDFDFTYYYMYSFDQILRNLPLPVSSGATGITTNEGVLTNQGIEFTINAVPIQTKDVLFRTSLNFSKNTNKVVSTGGDAKVIEIGNIWGLNGPSMALHAGDAYGTIYGYDYVYHENGQPILNDAGTKYEITDTRVPIGNSAPDFLAGWSTELHYKGFTLTTLIDTKWGGDIYAGSYVIGLQTGQSPETLYERDGNGLPYTNPDGNTSNVGVILDGVYADGAPNDKVVHYYYKYLPNAGGWGKFISTPGIVDNTWVKMREITLSYDIPNHIIQKTKIFQKLTLSVVGRDLFYIYTTIPDNINPEGIMGSGNAQGFEWASMPASRSFTFGVTAKF